MTAKNDSHFFIHWARARLDEMDATLTSLEGKVAGLQDDVRDKAGAVLTGLQKARDGFHDLAKEHLEADESAWATARRSLEAEWSAFQAELQKCVESFGGQFELQQATFKAQAEAQVKAWHDAADSLAAAAAEFAADSRLEIEVNLQRMKADAVAAEEQLSELHRAGAHSWSSLTAALAETRSAFDRAIHAVHELFKRSD